jgi:hypothetical protein
MNSSNAELGRIVYGRFPATKSSKLINPGPLSEAGVLGFVLCVSPRRGDFRSPSFFHS